MKKVLLPGLIAGLVMFIVAMALGQVFNAIFPNLAAEYQNTNLFRPWEDPLMSLYFLHPFVLGIALAWVWDKVKGLLKGSLWQRGSHFALIYWLAATIPGMLISYSSFPLSKAMVFSWAISSLAQVIAAGFVFAKMNK